MVLICLLLIPLLGGLLSWLANRWSVLAARWVALLATLGMLLLTIALWVGGRHHGGSLWLVELNVPWIPQIGSRIHLALDGLSLLLIALTAFLGVLSVAASWRGIDAHVGFFHFNLLLILSAITGVFLAVDLFVFYLFWELMLVPLFFLIDIWGHERRHYAALKFFIFTQTGGLFLLLGILALFFIHGGTTGHYTFDYQQLLGTPLHGNLAFWVMLKLLSRLRGEAAGGAAAHLAAGRAYPGAGGGERGPGRVGAEGRRVWPAALRAAAFPGGRLRLRPGGDDARGNLHPLRRAARLRPA